MLHFGFNWEAIEKSNTATLDQLSAKGRKLERKDTVVTIPV